MRLWMLEMLWFTAGIGVGLVGGWYWVHMHPVSFEQRELKAFWEEY